MPREIIEVVLTELDPYAAGSEFLAAVAYPDPLEKKQRDLFKQAIGRHTLEQLIGLNSEWANTPQWIRPAYFSGSEKLIDSSLKRGNKRLKDRLAAAQFILMPHLRALDTGFLEKVEGYKPTVNNMTHQILEFMGWKGDSSSTVKTKIWKPTRPVAHAAAAFVVWHQVLWEKWGRKPDVDKKLAFCCLPKYVEEVIEISEYFRKQLPEINQFKLHDDETIQFSSRWL